MTNEDIIRMAREAGGDDWGIFRDFMPEIERFAVLVAAAERDACEDMVKNYMRNTNNMECRGCLASVAYDIRTRSEP